jgi:hypothetical protein
VSVWKPGDPFHARDTELIRRCGIRPGAIGHVTFVSGDRISFYIDRDPPGSGSIEASSPSGLFGNNFIHGVTFGNNAAYRSSKPFSREFPTDFIR